MIFFINVFPGANKACVSNLLAAFSQIKTLQHLLPEIARIS